MAEKLYPNSKPTAVPTPASATGKPSFPATKAHLYNHSRPVYRPQPRSYRRSCCCSCCLWITFTIILLLLIAAASTGVLYVFYRPHRPTFSLSSLHVSQFKLTSSNKLSTKFNITVTAQNPNKNIVLEYDPVTVTFSSNDVDVGDGTMPAFITGKKNTTSLRTVVGISGQSVDDDSGLKSDVKKKKSLLLKIELDTNVKAKIGRFKSKKVPIRVTCDGVNVAVPVGKKGTTAVTDDVNCKVDLRIKIWKWTV